MDNAATVNILPAFIVKRISKTNDNLVLINITISNFIGEGSDTGVILSLDVLVGTKAVMTSFFVIDITSMHY